MDFCTVFFRLVFLKLRTFYGLFLYKITGFLVEKLLSSPYTLTTTLKPVFTGFSCLFSLIFTIKNRFSAQTPGNSQRRQTPRREKRPCYYRIGRSCIPDRRTIHALGLHVRALPRTRVMYRSPHLIQGRKLFTWTARDIGAGAKIVHVDST